ncbi:substrate binding domain-containing protein [Burkholderia sp. WAC0059]|uniref:substrate binding domain-containing protein n=1 Tax=Burkholderia sp. WAC0059 TaxID=2066022 RepID=UPI00215568A8|nr:substrate binding domain-containing protein [Burkholderia sp. WAC0059]
MFERVCVASRDYLAKRGIPCTPGDLQHHDCIVYTLLSSGSTWHLRDQEASASGRLRVNSPQAVQEAVGSGIGIAHGPRWLFEAGLSDGSLKLLLDEYAPPPVPIQLLYVANRLLPKRAIAFMDFIAAVYSATPELNVNQLESGKP